MNIIRIFIVLYLRLANHDEVFCLILTIDYINYSIINCTNTLSIDVTRAIKLTGLKAIAKMFNRAKGMWYDTIPLNKEENILKL